MRPVTITAEREPQLVDLGSRRGKGRGFESLHDALWSRVIPGHGGCLIYAHNPDPYGYGQVSYKPRAPHKLKAHRVSWELRYGSLDEGVELDHLPSCDKRCVNTDHLTPHTRSEHQKITMRRPEERPKHMHPYAGECSIDGCDRKPSAKGLCNLHRQRLKNGTPMELPPMTNAEAGRRAAAARWRKDN